MVHTGKSNTNEKLYNNFDTKKVLFEQFFILKSKNPFESLWKAEGYFLKQFLFSEICISTSFSPRIRLKIIFIHLSDCYKQFFEKKNAIRLTMTISFKWRGYTIIFRIQKDLRKYHVIFPKSYFFWTLY